MRGYANAGITSRAKSSIERSTRACSRSPNQKLQLKCEMPTTLLHALDLADAGVGRADDEIAVEQVVDVGLGRRRHRDRVAVLHALVVVAQAQRHPHVPARLLGGVARVGLVLRHVDRALHADLERLRRLHLGHDVVEELAGTRASRSTGTPKPPVSTLKPRRTAASIEYGLCAVIQIGGCGFCTGFGKIDVSGILKSLPS